MRTDSKFINENDQLFLDVAVSKDNVQLVAEKLYQKYNDKAQIPGFRKGKAPIGVLKQKFGSALRAEILYELINEAMEDVFQRWDINTNVGPKLENEEGLLSEFDEESDAHFRVEVDKDKLPKVDIAPYTDLEFDVPKIVITDDDITRIIDNKRADLGTLKDRSEKDELEDKDLLQLEVSYKIEGVDDIAPVLRRYEIGDEHNVVLSPYSDDLKRLKVNQSLEKDVESIELLSDAYKDHEGKNGKICIKIVNASYKDLPPIDDELAKDLNFDSLDALKADIREKLEKEAEAWEKHLFFDKIYNHLVDKSTFHLSEETIKDLIQNSINYMLSNLQYQYRQKFTLEQYLALSGQSREELEEQLRESSIEDEKTRLVVREIILNEKLEVTPEQELAYAEDYSQGQLKKPLSKLKREDRDYLMRVGFLTKVREAVDDFLFKNNAINHGKETPLHEIVDHHHHEHHHHH